LPITSNASLAAVETITDSNTDAVGARQRMLQITSSQTGGFSIWGQGLYSQFHGSDEDSYSGHGAGGVVGFDFSQAEKGHFGLALTIYNATLDEKSPLIAKTDAKSYLISPYVGFRIQNFFLDAQLNAGESNLDTTRTVNVESITRVATGKANEMLAAGGISSGYIWDIGFIRLIPQININGIEMFDHNYTESGGGAGVDLTINSHHQSSLRSFVGFAADGSYQLLGMRLVPQVLTGWSQELIGGAPTVNAAFASNPDSTFEVSGPGAARSRLIAGGGFDFVASNWSIGLNYNATISSSALSQTAGLSMSARF
ncbi:MAG TPA: autotransporter outer membrane beta-barrel domain-containing protein, partial [Micropepsaceae bacterium]|nr:autotransporter outer membrane beta-barrel domain-containing protein [Micropepsaceae bacterium]